MNKNFPQYQNLTGKILVATPGKMKNTIFEKSLIYVLKHSGQGSLGIMFNKLIDKDIASDTDFTLKSSIAKDLKKLFPNYKIDQNSKLSNDDVRIDLDFFADNCNIFLGGPESSNDLFLLYQNNESFKDFEKNSMINLELNQLSISNNGNLLKFILNQKFNQKNISQNLDNQNLTLSLRMSYNLADLYNVHDNNLNLNDQEKKIQNELNFVFCSGYTKWKAFELEFEVINDLWVVLDYQKDLLFSNLLNKKNNLDKWLAALNILGLNQHCFTAARYI